MNIVSMRELNIEIYTYYFVILHLLKNSYILKYKCNTIESLRQDF